MVAFITANSSDIDLSKMGFPTGWDQEDLWNPTYKPQIDPVLARYRQIRNRFECVGASNVGLILAPTKVRTEAADQIRTLRHESALLGLQMEKGAAFSFPIFQFDKSSPRVLPVVARLNRSLDAKGDPWGAAEWWITPNSSLEGRTPLQHLEDDLLTESSMEALLMESQTEV